MDTFIVILSSTITIMLRMRMGLLLVLYLSRADLGKCTRVAYVNKGLVSIPANGTNAITILDLERNHITRMVTDALTTYPRIHTLKVTRNTLRYIDEGAFNGINVLKKNVSF